MGSEFGGGSEVSDTSEGIKDKVPSPKAEVPRRKLSLRGIRAMQGIGAEETVTPQGQENKKDIGKSTQSNQQNKS